jgi:hypothetical protein
MDGDVQTYYRSPAVRVRLAEFCGACVSGSGAFTSRYLVAYRAPLQGAGQRCPTAAFDRLLDEGVDIGRSLWDAAGLVADLDIDYQNVDFPAEGLLHPEATFEKLEPVHVAVSELCAELGLSSFTMLSAKGYHVLWYVPAQSAAYAALVELGEVLPSLAERYQRGLPDIPERVSLELGRAYDGLGRVLEYLVHQVLVRVRDVTVIPAVTTGLRVGSRLVGREAISLDLSAFGDPLHIRELRCAYTVCRRHHYAPGFAGTVAAEVPPLVYVPRTGAGLSLHELLRVRCDLRRAAELASAVPAHIPDGSAGTLALVQRYRRSALYRFHREFYAGWHDPPEQWPAGYDRLDLRTLPPCVAEPLRRPNDWLLKPTNIQTIARVLWSLGWHPRAIAGLIRSKYERDYGWGDRWEVADPAQRADFYVRLFCGLVATGVDALEDFNCISQQEKGYCPRPGCGHNLLDYRPALLIRRTA